MKTVLHLDCGCIIAYNARHTNDENLVLDWGMCQRHRQLTVLVPEPKTWETRQIKEK